MGGPITGKGAEFIVVDDPMKYQEVNSEARRDDVARWMLNLPTRLNDPKSGGILLIAQRLHEDDVVGRLLSAGGWEYLCLPLTATQEEKHERGPNLSYTRKAGEYLHPARIDAAVAERMCRELGDAAFQAQYQQNPLPPGSAALDLGLFKRYTTPPKFEHIFFSVDVATIVDGGDYSVCTMWGYVERDFYLLDVWRKQVSFPQLRDTLIGLCKQWQPSLMIIESVGSGIALCQDLEKILGRYVVRNTPLENKAHQFEAVTLMMANGHVWLPTSAPWLETLCKELQSFPQGKHDDQVDSLSQLLFRWERLVQLTRTRCNPAARRDIPTNYKVAATLKISVRNI